MQLKTFIAVAAVILLIAAARSYASSSGIPPLQTVDRVDLSRYLGKWYEIARLPNRFQKGCAGSSADYSLRDDGEIAVINSCKNADDGSIRQAKGRAWSVDPAGNAKLKVSFFWPFRGDYWIIELGKEYEYAVVGTPDRKYLWVLSRTTTMSDEFYAAIMRRLEQQGFDTLKIQRDTQISKGIN
ncbi:MAG: lipocalin family protein [Deltaproteobacteria bacterium]|nr:lipocalin family protein [Deltaproteobacteria bacterium]